MAEGPFNTLMTMLETWQGWVKGRPLIRSRIIDAYMTASIDHLPLVKGAIEQIRMVAQFYGMKSASLMDAFASAGSRAILIPEINSQAVALRQVILRLKTEYGPRYPYGRCR